MGDGMTAYFMPRISHGNGLVPVNRLPLVGSSPPCITGNNEKSAFDIAFRHFGNGVFQLDRMIVVIRQRNCGGFAAGPEGGRGNGLWINHDSAYTQGNKI